MANIEGLKLSEIPDAGLLDGSEETYLVAERGVGPVNRRTSIDRIRQGLATIEDLNSVSVGAGNVPAGGAAGAALIKASAESYDTMWDTTGGTGHVPDPANEPDGRKLVTQTGGLVYVDDDPNQGLLPDPAQEPDGLIVTTDQGGYTLAAPQGAPVTSVAGRTGDVVLTNADVGLGNVNNTADSAKPVSTAQATAISTAVSTHEVQPDPHPQYLQASDVTSHVVSTTVNAIEVLTQTEYDLIVTPDPDTLYGILED